MGRALYSQMIFQSAAAAVPTPEIRSPSPEDPSAEAPIVQYQKWSSTNNFDPDSDEFFLNAEWEAFLDPPSPVEDSSSSSSSSSGDEDRSSPMAVGADDPAAMIAAAYPSAASSSEWRQRFLLAGSAGAGEWYFAGTNENLDPRDREETRETPSEDATDNNAPPSPISEATARPTTPIDIPGRDTMPALVDWPSTPPIFSYGSLGSSQMSPPSPPPTVSPRLYTWSRLQASPTPAATSGPLTNPSARMSFSRITPVARVRVQGFAA